MRESMNSPLLEIKNLHVEVEGKEILKGISLTMNRGEIHAIMGRNGSGKTTLANVVMGHPQYIVTRGDILLAGESILNLAPYERARKRLFLAFQYPVAVPGISVGNFLRASLKAVRGDEIPIKEMRQLIRTEMKQVGVNEDFLKRFLNDGFSGGEKKRLEMLQMQLLQPKVAILDETDSGLDIDSLKKVSSVIEACRNPNRSILLITHYQRLLSHVKPDHVHVLLDGKIVKSGCSLLAEELEKKGYDWVEPVKPSSSTAPKE